MRKIIALAAILLLAACGTETATPIDSTDIITGDDLTIVNKHHEGRDYTCFYIYVDGERAGGPAMWCERKDAQ